MIRSHARRWIAQRAGLAHPVADCLSLPVYRGSDERPRLIGSPVGVTMPMLADGNWLAFDDPNRPPDCQAWQSPSILRWVQPWPWPQRRQTLHQLQRRHHQVRGAVAQDGLELLGSSIKATDVVQARKVDGSLWHLTCSERAPDGHQMIDRTPDRQKG